MRDRAKEHFPTVLLTLLSIVQALALELLWGHVNEADYLFEPSWISVLSWAQIAVNFLGIVLIWVVYASNVMRFSWVPTTTDSVLPFLIGLLQFMLVATLGPGQFGWWFMFMAMLVGIMNWIAHVTMVRARADNDNEAFFSDRPLAKLADFYPPMVAVAGLSVAGIYLLASEDTGVVAMLAILMTGALLAWQFQSVSRFWDQSVNQD